ncbi:MAG: flippase activity-associated protein Agl23 [Spartobacteria bacterium]
MRTAPDSSADAGALADFPALREQLETWRARLAETEWTPWLIVGLAALLRLFLLGIKPPHFDEGINGWFVDQLVKNGYYKYDPTNYHGPLHFYVLLAFQTLFGRNYWALRMPVVLVSISSVWLMMKYEPFVGRNASRLAALAMAISTGFVFYGRYSIHEAWLVLFSMLFVLGVLGLRRAGTVNYLWCLGVGLTGMILTKETYVIHIGCALVALGVFHVSNRLNPVPDARAVKQTWDYVDLAVVMATGVILIVFFYSGTFLHWSGVRGIFQAYGAWFKTGHEGHGHEKPFYYWLNLILRYEPTVLAGLIACAFCQQFKTFALRYLAIYGVGTIIAYSIVRYKTPWCIISIIWPLLLIFGAAFFLIPARHRLVAHVVAAILLIVSFSSSVWLNYFHCTTDSEPYVYVQTYNDIDKLTRPVLSLARRNPSYYYIIGHMIRPSPYPLPWILGNFPNVGYYEKGKLPPNADADFLLVQEEKIAEVEKQLHDNYYTQPLRIRPYQDISKLYLSAKRFKEFFPDRAPDFTGAPPQP